MAFTKDDVLEALRGVRGVRAGSAAADVVSAGAVLKAASCDGYVSATLAVAGDDALRAELKRSAAEAIRRHAESKGESLLRVEVEVVKREGDGARGADRSATVEHPADVSMKQGSSSKTVRTGEARPGSPSMPGVRHIIAVGAGKGGVGKSTVSVNLAVGLARQGHTVGLLDGDIYGPSAPTLLGLDAMEATLFQNRLQVFCVHGIKAMTLGKLVDPEKPLIWRGPMAHGAFKQLCEQTDWGELDYLIIDLPPGTGDVPLTMSQMLSLSGAVVVCTPQKVAQDDAVRAVRMFQQLNIDVLGVVENMSYFVGDDGKTYDIFGRGGAEQMAQRLGLPFLGSIPITMRLREYSDAGEPVRNFTEGGDALRESLERLVRNVEDQVAMASLRAQRTKPTLTVS